MSGDMHSEGSMWHEGCNTCVCQAGLISCSPTSCSSHSCTHPAPDDNGCCEVCDRKYILSIFQTRGFTIFVCSQGVNIMAEYMTTESAFNQMHVKCAHAWMDQLCVITMTGTVPKLTVTSLSHCLANVARLVPEIVEDVVTFDHGKWINAQIAVAS